MNWGDLGHTLTPILNLRLQQLQITYHDLNSILTGPNYKSNYKNNCSDIYLHVINVCKQFFIYISYRFYCIANIAHKRVRRERKKIEQKTESIHNLNQPKFKPFK